MSPTATAKKKVSDTPPAPSTTQAEWVWVTPDEAQKMLQHNSVNRDLRPHDMESYERMMRDGTWGICIEPIAFDTNGNLINGQHRLTAQVRSETSHWWLVIKDVPPEANKTVNAGARVRLSDVLKYNGETNYIVLAGVTNNAYMWQHDLLGVATRVQPMEGELFLDQHPELRHSTDLARRVAQSSVIDIGATVLGCAHWIISQANNVYEADRFLMRMAQLHYEKPGSAILALLRRMNRAGLEKHQRPTIRDQIAAVIKVWNFDVEGRYVSRIIIGNRTGWQNPMPLSKDTLMTEEEFMEFPSMEEVELPAPDPENVVDEGEDD